MNKNDNVNEYLKISISVALVIVALLRIFINNNKCIGVINILSFVIVIFVLFRTCKSKNVSVIKEKPLEDIWDKMTLILFIIGALIIGIILSLNKEVPSKICDILTTIALAVSLSNDTIADYITKKSFKVKDIFRDTKYY